MLLGGIIWIILMTAICYVGIEVSANFQKILLGIELTMLFVLSIVALVKVGNGSAPPGHLTPSISWLNPFKISSFSAFASGIILMVFIYWGWDTAVAVNEETKDKTRTPGLAAIFSTIILLFTYALVIFSMQAFAGVKTTGNGLGNINNAGDVLSVQGSAIFGTTGFGPVFYHLLLLMVLSSAAASTQTTILPTARTTLSMAAYKALPKSFATVHPRFMTPTVSTIVMGAISIVLYAGLNYTSNGIGVIGDAVIAIGLYIAFYYGLTGFACAWYYRKNLTSSTRNLFMQGILPVSGALILWFLGGWSIWLDYDVATANDFTMWTVPGHPLADRRRLRDRGGGRAGRGGLLPVLPVHQAGPALLQEADPDQGHPDPGSRRVARPGGAAARPRAPCLGWRACSMTPRSAGSCPSRPTPTTWTSPPREPSPAGRTPGSRWSTAW